MKESRRKRVTGALLLLTAAVVAAVFPAPAGAALERVGPVNAAIGGYPAWYQDSTGVALEFCTPVNQAELNDGWCTILPADVPTGAAPEVPFTNYSGEHFYWIASAGNRTSGLLTLALEAAFNTADPVAGEQIVFGRVRITIPSLPASGDYKVYTPFGDFDFPGQVAGSRLFFTSDIGITCGADFSCALSSNIGPFLVPSDSPGGTELPPVGPTTTGLVTPYPGTGKLYLADPARIGPVTGSPLPPFTAADGQTYNHNRFRIEANGTLLLDEQNFSVGGRVMTASIPGRVDVKRASYSDQTNPPLRKIDVFATAFPTVQGRVPPGSVIPSTNPDLGFYPAPCATDPVTGAVTGPPTGAGLVYYQMFRSGNNWWGQHLPPADFAMPLQVCVQDHNSRNVAGQVVPAYYMGNMTDEVDLTVANWDPAQNGGTLTVQAASSDQVTLPALTLDGFGPFTAGQFQVSDLAAPPDKVTVTSVRGGVATLDVRTGVGIPVSMTTPVANADTATTNEDTPITGINVLANDTLTGAPIDPASATVAITASGAPRLGTATVNADNTVTYTPNPNANGTDIVGYTVTVNGFTSNEGYLTVIVNPVNDPPVANNDSTGAPNNRAVTINVLANDADPDGAADLAAAAIASLPAAGATLTCNGGAVATVGTVCAGGSVTFTPTATGTFSFTYRAQDQAGAQSANAATVTVTVNATENIVVTRSQFTSKQLRWVVNGTDSAPSGQTLAIRYDIATPPTYKKNGVCTAMTAADNPVIGTATVDALGNWALDVVVSSAGFVNPTNTGSNGTGFWCSPPRAVRVTSPLGGASSSNISFK